MFFSGEAARITGVTYRNIDHWARTKFIVPSIADANGTGTERMRRVVSFLRAKRGLRNPLAERRLIVVGSDVQLVHGCEEMESLLHKPGQAVFAFMLDLGRTVEEIKQNVQTLRVA